MTTTNTQGAAIARYKIGYPSDEWGMRGSSPSTVPDAVGPLVTYADHISRTQETEATHLRELAAYRLTVENLEREIAAQQPAPSPVPASKAALAAIRAANMQLVRTGDDEYMLVTFKQATPQADSQPAPVRDYPPLPDFDTVEQHIYGACRRYITQDMLEPIHNLIRETVDADRAARAPAERLPVNWRAEVERVICRMDSSDPDFDDCADAVALIIRLAAEVTGPEGYATWKDAAVAERIRASSMLEDAEIDRIVPALEPVSEDFPAEWAVWKDRERIREELRAARKQGEKQ